MFLALDIIVVVVFAATVINCVNRGFVRSVLSLLKSVLALLAAYIFSPALAEFFGKFFDRAITGAVEQRLEAMVGEAAGKFNLEKLFSDKPKEFLDILDRFGGKVEDLAGQYGSVSGGSELQLTDMARQITGPVVDTVSYICAFLAIFVAALIVLAIAEVILSAVVKLPVIHGADKLLGAVFGVASGFVIAFILSLLAKEGFEALAAAYPDKFGGVIEKTFVVKLLGELEIGKIFIR